MEFWIKAAQLLLSLSILITLHELGHFIPARLFKTRVNKFYLFFDFLFPLPNVLNFSLFKFKKGETTYGLGWFPFGGYVQIAGMVDETQDGEEMQGPPKPWEFRSKPAWQRLIIMIGGIAVNMIMGIFIYIFVVFAWGTEQLKTADLEHGLAIHPYMEQYGLSSGDNILEINGEEVTHLSDINAGIMIRDHYELKVQKEDGTIQKITLPDDVEYSMFENGAGKAFDLRTETQPVHHLSTGFSDEENGIYPNDIIYKINGELIGSGTDITQLKNSTKPIDLTLIHGADTVNTTLPAESVSAFFEASPSLDGGILPGDLFLEIDGTNTHYFDQLTAALHANKNRATNITVLRGTDTITKTIKVTPDGSLRFSYTPVKPLDFDKVQTVHYGFGASIGKGFNRGITTLRDYVGQLKFLFTKKGASSIGGFGTIGGLFPATWDWQIFWLNTALISIILAFMNFLPIPMLDGGYILFLLYEMIVGKPAPEKVQEYAQQIGFFIIIALLLYANANDVLRALGF